MQYTTPIPALIAPGFALPMQAARAASDASAKRRAAACRAKIDAERHAKDCDANSAWRLKHLTAAANAQNIIATEDRILAKLSREQEADDARARVTDLPLNRFAVRDMNTTPDASGRYRAVLDMVICNPVRIQFFGDCSRHGEQIVPGTTYPVQMPDGSRYRVEVL